MSIDWVIRWREKKPGEGELLAAVRAYMGETGDVWKDNDHDIVAIMAGNAWWVLPPSLEWMKPYLPVVEGFRRIEVYPDDEGVTVTVRQADEFTQAVADGLAKVIARIWQAALVEPD